MRKQQNKFWLSEMPIGQPIEPRQTRRHDVFSAIMSLVASTVLKSIFAPDTPKAPSVTAPTAMPTPGDAADKAAKRLSLTQQMQRQGRASTILTDTGTSDKLGG